MELQLQTRTYYLILGQWKIPFDTMLHYATKLNLITEKGRWCDLGVDSVFVTTLLTDFLLHTVDWLNLILSKTNGGGEQVTSEPCIAWSLIIQFLSPARDRAGRIALLPPLFHGLTAVATRLLLTCVPRTLLCDLSPRVTVTRIKGVTVTWNSGLKTNQKNYARARSRQVMHRSNGNIFHEIMSIK